MKCYPYHSRDDLWRSGEYCYYLEAENGLFVVKRNPLFSAVVRAYEVPNFLCEEIKRINESYWNLGLLGEDCLIHFPKKIPASLIMEITDIFRTIWLAHHTEAHVQLFVEDEDDTFFYRTPNMWASRYGDFCWFEFLASEPDTTWAGTAHSHGAYDAGQSHLDYSTEQDVDGLHLTIGNVDLPFPTLDARIVIDGVSFDVDPEKIIERVGYQKGAEPPKINILDPQRTYRPGSSGSRALKAYFEPITAIKREQEYAMAEKTFVLIGLGGIGSHLAPILCRWLNHHEPDVVVRLIDGKRFTDRKRERQNMPAVGNKARVLAQALTPEHDRLEIQSIERFADAENIELMIPEGAVVFLAPDNHRTRKLVSDHVSTLRDAVLIVGGNNAAADDGGHDGSVLVHVRRDGRDITAPITAYHPEIAEPDDDIPNAAGCDELQASVPQLLVTNASVALYMLNTFLAWRAGTLTYGELCIRMGEEPKVLAHERPPQP